MKISNEAVEAAAKAVYEVTFTPAVWEVESEDYMDEMRETVRIALEAAAPHMMAPILALMADPEHYDSQGPSNGYVSVDNLRAAMGSPNA